MTKFGWMFASVCLLAACGGGDGDVPLPTIQRVVINATSTPPGATVSIGATTLGQTPLQGATHPAPYQAGSPLTLTFALDGHGSSTQSLTPAGGVVTANVALSPQDTGGGADAPIGSDINQRFNGGGTIRDLRRVSASGTVARDCVVGSMGITLHGRHAHHGDLRATVRLPNGSTRTFARGRGRSSRFFGRRFRVQDASGISSAGQYVVTIRDGLRQDRGRFTGFTLSIGCQ